MNINEVLGYYNDFKKIKNYTKTDLCVKINAYMTCLELGTLAIKNLYL